MSVLTESRTRRATPAGSLTVDDCAQMQSELRGLSKRDAVAVVQSWMPHLSRSWIVRNFSYVVELDPDALAVVLTYADPTGERATRRADRRGGGREHA